MSNPISLKFEVKVDPKRLSINKKLKAGVRVDPDVVKAQKKIVDAAREVAAAEGFAVSPKDYFGTAYVFVFPDFRGDLSNPLKRTEDALAQAFGFVDSRVMHISMDREVGEPAVRVHIWKAGKMKKRQEEQVDEPPKWLG